MKFLSNKEIKNLNNQLEIFNVSFSKKDRIALKDNVLFVNDKPLFFVREEQYVPLLTFLQEQIVLPKVIVDMGAVKFVISGADIMRPGITSFETFNKNDFVVIVDANNQKPLAVGTALDNSEELKNSSSGKAIKNIHYVGDTLWSIATR
ncbi:DUF1947 domain-containing protein [Candidatus Woesearchaeota archaeon]|nr:DUF1947 domain-containing protein [Candidatus Woesearchaeota archaeon]